MSASFSITASKTWDFATGRGLPAGQALTTHEGCYAARLLVAALAGDVELGQAFWRRAAAVRDGQSASTTAQAWVRPQAGNPTPVVRLLEVAAGSLDPAAAADALGHERACVCVGCEALRDGFHALERACGAVTIRALDADGRPIPLDGDRERALRADWRLKLREGVRLLALRAAGRCMTCERELRADESLRLREAGPRSTRTPSDYCDEHDCGTNWRHVDARNAVLASAAQALSGHARDTLRRQRP